ncbi:MAG: 3-carboxy-cis,cis-muconate cycloisomerase [Actinomycetota bacterium]|nr:3-carboxy-cis,cis-muconate cycloisomerase [Actinomycetota bacterium]
MTDLGDTMFSTRQMSEIFSGESRAQRMLDFEAALARAEAQAGLIPQEAADAIASKCRAELFDLARLYAEAATAGTAAIPLVKMLTTLVDEDARGYVHWGSTSQDVIDTAMILQARDGLDLLIDDLMAVGVACVSLTEDHRAPMAGRTLLQHALPITFGLKAARWLALVTRQVLRLRDLRGRVLVVQFGGAAGTLASLDAHGIRVAELLAKELNLSAPELPWHAERDRVAEVATSLGIVAGSMAKIAGDVVLLMQTEVGEVSEGASAGPGTSSALPHKRNPVLASGVIASARLATGTVPIVLSAMMQEHERAAGGWQAEWLAIPELFRLTAATVDRVRSIVENIEIDSERMSANLDATGGQIMSEALVMALAPHVGRLEAYRLVASAGERAYQQGTDLRSVAAADEQIGRVLAQGVLESVFSPDAYLGSADAFVERAVESFRAIAGGRGTS